MRRLRAARDGAGLVLLAMRPPDRCATAAC
jgi:hypothetical protein